MKIYLKDNVWDAAIKRLRWLFNEFENVIVNISGGKDSTVIYNLALLVAEEMGRLPLQVMFIDQEAEWNCVIEHVRRSMHDPRVKPLWLQVPIKLFNATSSREPWLYCWQPGAEWMRDKEPDSIQENTYGTDRFAELFGAYLRHEYPASAAINLAGVRCEESPNRALGLTTSPTYKHITWGKIRDSKRQHFDFYPLYDWSYTDIWKAIHDNHWPYCSLYDVMYQYGVPLQMMRVSNVHHETAVDKLFYLQEFEADTWERLTRRIAGVNTAGKLGFADFFLHGAPLPPMFDNWAEYRDYLVANLIEEPAIRAKFTTYFHDMDRDYQRGMYRINGPEVLYKAQINTVLANDYHFTKLKSFRAGHRDKNYAK